MANLIEEVQWVDGIYQLERTDPVEGGADGIANLQAKQLANRTQYLKEMLSQQGLNLDDLEKSLARTWIVDEYANDEHEHQLGLAVYRPQDINAPKPNALWFSKRFKWINSDESFSEMAISFSGSKPQFAIRHRYGGVTTSWNVITDYADANVATQQALTAHNDNANAHPALMAAINDQVALAQTAAEAAIQNGGMYATSAAGIAATSTGAYFRVVGSGDVALQVYKNNNGTAELVTQLAAKQMLDNAIALLNQFNLTTVKKDQLVISKSANLAKPSLIELDKYINNAGNITTAAGWKLIRIPITPGQTYTFGHFQIDTAGYWATWDASNVKQQNGSFQNMALPVSITASATSTTLLITIARPSNLPEQIEKLTVNEGSSLIDYVNPADKLIGIGEYTIAANGSNVEVPENVAEEGEDVTFAKLTADSIEASAIIINLPTGAGAPPVGVESNQAWIDTSAGNVIKVKP